MPPGRPPSAATPSHALIPTPTGWTWTTHSTRRHRRTARPAGRSGLGALLAQHQERPQTLLAFRLDPRLRTRVDAADVAQEAFAVATARRADFFRQSRQPLFLRLRWVAGITLLELHRHHLGSQVRDPSREVPSRRLAGGAGADDTRDALAAQLSRRDVRAPSRPPGATKRRRGWPRRWRTWTARCWRCGITSN